jgi:hypothetical protein
MSQPVETFNALLYPSSICDARKERTTSVMCIDSTDRAGNFRESETTGTLTAEHEVNQDYPFSIARAFSEDTLSREWES